MPHKLYLPVTWTTGFVDLQDLAKPWTAFQTAVPELSSKNPDLTISRVRIAILSQQTIIKRSRKIQ